VNEIWLFETFLIIRSRLTKIYIDTAESTMMMTSEFIVIAVSGMPGSGKGCFIVFYEKRGATVFRMGDMVRKEVETRKLTLDPENVGRVANEMRKVHGPDIWARRTLEALRHFMNKHGKTRENKKPEERFIVIDGIRSMREVEFFKKRIPGFHLVSIHTSPELRWKRMTARRRSDDFPEEALFRERDCRELDWGIAEVIALSDEIISNNGTLEELEEKAEGVLGKFIVDI